MSMNSLWWLALPVLLLPVWWHRQKREQTRTLPLATARFVPRVEPNQVRVWRWVDIVLLLVRCLLLAAVVAWLADPVLPWRPDSVLVVKGTDAAWAEKQIAAAGLKDAQRIELPAAQALEWVRIHQFEWRTQARVLVLGDVPMPAGVPKFGRRVELVTAGVSMHPVVRHVAIVSARAQEWRRMFAALDGGDRYVIDSEPTSKSDLVIWDVPQPPADGLRAPLWWVADANAFPELRDARQVDGMRYADSAAHGRLWSSPAWPPKDADSARRLFETWQRLHFAPAPFTAPSHPIEASRAGRPGDAEGELRATLAWLIVALFGLERILTHARRR
ncbi:MAG: BatA domain-containing protein [Telluria sp.]